MECEECGSLIESPYEVTPTTTVVCDECFTDLAEVELDRQGVLRARYIRLSIFMRAGAKLHNPQQEEYRRLSQKVKTTQVGDASEVVNLPHDTFIVGEQTHPAFTARCPLCRGLGPAVVGDGNGCAQEDGKWVALIDYS